MYCFFEGVASPKIVGLTITSHKFFFRSSYILSLYAFQLKLHNWIGEQNIGGMPPELDRYLIDLLRSNSSYKTVFTIYEKWWASSLPLIEKLGANPLKSYPYFWNTF